MRESVHISNSQQNARKATDAIRRERKETAEHEKQSRGVQKNTRAGSSDRVRGLYNEWIFLCAGLCVCFLLLITSGDALRSISESDGINAISSSIMHVMTENEAVAVFFGISDEVIAGEEPTDGSTDTNDGEKGYVDVFSEWDIPNAEEFIEKYNTQSYNTSGQIPVHGTVTSLYSFRKNPFYGRYEDEDEYEFHSGIDIAADEGTEILAYLDGTVEKSALSASYGYYICIDHGNGLKTLYAHASKLLCSEGDKVSKGQPIALVGDTGRATGAHLHFEVYEEGETQNPEKYLSGLFV